MSINTRDTKTDIYKEVVRAHTNLNDHLAPTPLIYSQHISDLGGARVFLKMESWQPTGSFKIRGALNTLLSLTDEERRKGVVTASSGNHGLAVAYAASILKLDCEVVVPTYASNVKTTAIQKLGGEIIFNGSDIVETEAFARVYAVQKEKVYVPPYNDIRVIGGQGTIALELGDQLDRIDTVYVAVGGGGLVSGIAGYCKAALGPVRVIGCQPVNSPVMAESVREGRIVEMESTPTLSDGTAGGIEPGSITFKYCRKLIDSFSLIDETEITSAIRLFKEYHHEVIEGAAALPIAAFLKERTKVNQGNVVIVICGANLSPRELRKVT